MPIASWEALTGPENLLILAPRPGDETLYCGGLIARSCRRGRPPFVLVLTDGQTRAEASREPRTRAAMQALGLPANRMLMAGLYRDSLPTEGPAFDAIARGVAVIMWARDCNVICAPLPGEGLPDRTAAHRLANAVAAATGVGLLYYPGGNGGLMLDIAPEHRAKQAALGAYGMQMSDPQQYEAFMSPVADGV